MTNKAKCTACNGERYIGSTHEIPCPDCDCNAKAWLAESLPEHYISEEWCCFTDNQGIANTERLDGWLKNNNPHANRVTGWEPISTGVEWIGPNGYSFADSNPNGFTTVVLWRCKVQIFMEINNGN